MLLRWMITALIGMATLSCVRSKAPVCSRQNHYRRSDRAAFAAARSNWLPHQPHSAPMTLLPELNEFVRDHRPHGQMIGDATVPAWNGYLLTVACPCAVVFERWVTPEEADADLVRWAALN